MHQLIHQLTQTMCDKGMTCYIQYPLHELNSYNTAHKYIDNYPHTYLQAPRQIPTTNLLSTCNNNIHTHKNTHPQHWPKYVLQVQSSFRVVHRALVVLILLLFPHSHHYSICNQCILCIPKYYQLLHYVRGDRCNSYLDNNRHLHRHL